jgi:hypothetical protein
MKQEPEPLKSIPSQRRDMSETGKKIQKNTSISSTKTRSSAVPNHYTPLHKVLYQLQINLNAKVEYLRVGTQQVIYLMSEYVYVKRIIS